MSTAVGVVSTAVGGVSTAVLPLFIIIIMCWALTRIFYSQDWSGGPLLAVITNWSTILAE